MTWISVNPVAEREEVVQAAMAISGWYQQGWDEEGDCRHEIPDPLELAPETVAALYNNADDLGLNIYTIGEKEAGEENEDWGQYDDDENGPGLG